MQQSNAMVTTSDKASRIFRLTIPQRLATSGRDLNGLSVVNGVALYNALAPRAYEVADMLSIVTVLAIMPASQAFANPPTIVTTHISTTGVAPGFSQACGFTIMRHRDMTIRLHSFTDHNGNLVREVENFREIGYFSANGISLDYNQAGPGQATYYPDGSILEVSNGLFFNIRLHGGNFHLAGRFWTLVDANDNVIDEGFNGVDHRDIDDFCAALTRKVSVRRRKRAAPSVSFFAWRSPTVRLPTNVYPQIIVLCLTAPCSVRPYTEGSDG